MKYRRDSAQYRIYGKDYSKIGIYSVTICTLRETNPFGEIDSGKMILNEYGKIVDDNWNNLLTAFNTIELDEFVVMPNHFHGIIKIIIDGGKPLGEMVRYFKARSCRMIHKAGFEDFAWKPRYYDNIIRNNYELNNVEWYIRKNPKKVEEELEKIRNGFDKAQ